MKIRKELVAIFILLAAFIGFFINVLVVVNGKNAQIHDLRKENEALHNAYEALQRDHGELREDKMKTIGELRKRLDKYERETVTNGE